MDGAQGSTPNPRVWAVGSGKGGVGKSVILSNLAVILARRGKRCILLDADLGGANLHTLLGVPYPERTLTDFLRRDVESLQDIILPTPTPNLWLVSGAKALMDMANPHHAQKVKLIRQLFSLDVDHILIDLGAGSAFTALDFFLAAHAGVLVIMPTPTSVENAYHFLKAALYRKVKRSLRRHRAEHFIDPALEERVVRGARPAWDLIDQLARRQPELAVTVARESRNFRPYLVVNHANGSEEKRLGQQVVTACREIMGVPLHWLGELHSDERVLRAVQQRRPVYEAFPGCAFSLDLEGIALRLLDGHPQGGYVAQGTA